MAGFTFPDYRIPVIPAQGVIPVQSTEAPIAAFGGTQARDLQETARNLDKTSDNLFGLFQHEAKIANDTRIEEDLNKFISAKQALLFTAPDAFYRKKGEDAINGVQGASERLSALKAQFLEGASNRYQKLQLSHRLDAQINEATEGMSRHVAAQSLLWQGQTIDGRQAVLRDQAALDPSQVDALAIAAQTTAIDKARLAGHAPDSDYAKMLIRENRSEIFSTVIRKAIATGDMSAITLYQRYSSELDSKDNVALEAAIKTMSEQADAFAWVKGKGGGGGAPRAGGKVDNNVGNIVRSEFKYAGGKGAPQGAFETFETPEHGVAAAYITFQAKANQNGGTITFAELTGGNTEHGGKVKGWAETPRTEADKKNPMLAGNDAAAYAARLAQSVGLKPTDAVPLGDDAKMAKILREMNATEKGKITVPEEAFARGILLAKGDTSVVQAKAPGGAAPGPVADPLRSSVDAATGAPAPATTTEPDPLAAALNKNAASAPAARPTSTSSDGILNVRQREIEIEQQRVALTAANQAETANNPSLMQKRQAAIELQYTQAKHAVQLYKDVIWDRVQEHMTKGGPGGGPAVTPPPADIMSLLTFEQQRSIDSQVARNVEGKKTKTDQSVWYALYSGMTSPNANEREFWLKTQVPQYKEFLSDADFQEIVKLQAAGRKGEGKELTHVQTINSLVNDTLLQMGVDPTPKPGSNQVGEDTDAWKVATFHRTFQNELTVFEEAKGKKATPQEAQKIVDGLVKKVAASGWWTTERPVVFLRPKDVPEKDRADIIAAIRKNGGTPTEERVLDVYRHRLATQPTQTEIPRPSPRANVLASVEPIGVGAPGSGRDAPTPPPEPYVRRTAPFAEPMDFSRPSPPPLPAHPPGPAGQSHPGDDDMSLTPYERTHRALRRRLGLD